MIGLPPELWGFNLSVVVFVKRAASVLLAVLVAIALRVCVVLLVGDFPDSLVESLLHLVAELFRHRRILRWKS